MAGEDSLGSGAPDAIGPQGIRRSKRGNRLAQTAALECLKAVGW